MHFFSKSLLVTLLALGAAAAPIASPDSPEIYLVQSGDGQLYGVTQDGQNFKIPSGVFKSIGKVVGGGVLSGVAGAVLNKISGQQQLMDDGANLVDDAPIQNFSLGKVFRSIARVGLGVASQVIGGGNLVDDGKEPSAYLVKDTDGQVSAVDAAGNPVNSLLLGKILKVGFRIAKAAAGAIGGNNNNLVDDGASLAPTEPQVLAFDENGVPMQNFKIPSGVFKSIGKVVGGGVLSGVAGAVLNKISGQQQLMDDGANLVDDGSNLVTVDENGVPVQNFNLGRVLGNVARVAAKIIF